VADRAQRIVQHVREGIGVPSKQIGHQAMRSWPLTAWTWAAASGRRSAIYQPSAIACTTGGTVAIKVTVVVDEDRLREAGLATSGQEVMAVLEALRAGRRLTLQSAEHWLPVRDLRVRQKLGRPARSPAPGIVVMGRGESDVTRAAFRGGGWRNERHKAIMGWLPQC
jgi:hypothetical protein